MSIRTPPTEPLVRRLEAPATTWDSCYAASSTPWRSAGLTDTAARLISDYSVGTLLLEIGCGDAPDHEALVALGFDYVGLDLSQEAVRALNATGVTAVCGDLFQYRPAGRFNVVYDKGFFHGLAGARRRDTAARRIASVLEDGGVWVTVCGSADRRRTDFSHGAIYLRDLIGPAEIYFEALEVVKRPYGLLDTHHEFDAWHAAFRRR